MALKRNDACSHSMKAGVFVSCRLRYDADYAGQHNFFPILVTAGELPGNPTPSDAQVHAVADPKATALYNEWKNTLDANSVAPSKHTGQAATIIA